MKKRRQESYNTLIFRVHAKKEESTETEEKQQFGSETKVMMSLNISLKNMCLEGVSKYVKSN